jgi:hypothetical protein
MNTVKFWLEPALVWNSSHTGVQSINNVYAIVNKVENVLVNTYIFDLIDNDIYVRTLFMLCTPAYYLTH